MDKIQELREQRKRLEERIKQLENELKKPMSPDIEEDAQLENSREVTYSLYQVEKENLARLDTKIRESI